MCVCVCNYTQRILESWRSQKDILYPVPAPYTLSCLHWSKQYNSNHSQRLFWIARARIFNDVFHLLCMHRVVAVFIYLFKDCLEWMFASCWIFFYLWKSGWRQYCIHNVFIQHKSIYVDVVVGVVAPLILYFTFAICSDVCAMVVDRYMCIYTVFMYMWCRQSVFYGIYAGRTGRDLK